MHQGVLETTRATKPRIRTADAALANGASLEQHRAIVDTVTFLRLHGYCPGAFGAKSVVRFGVVVFHHRTPFES